MAFKTERIVAAISDIPRQILNELPGKLENAVSGIRVAVETTLTAAQNARDSTAATHARVDAIHTELQALRNDVQRQQPDRAERDNTQLLAELASLRAAVEGWRAEVAATRTTAATTTAEPEPTSTHPAQQAEPDNADFEQLLTLAAGIAYAEITCHRDHWDFLVAQSSSGQHFRLPGAVDEKDDGLITADISGRTLLAVLDALWKSQQSATADPGTRHLAAINYKRIGQALDDLWDHSSSPGPGRAGGHHPAAYPPAQLSAADASPGRD
ncbi:MULTISPECIES: hypothetical protein [Streptomyces]|uniref:hypothetical protein n=1 Tax=Streptomyces TaxID=1883 RepID=UPI00341346F8